jgi:transcription antitermination protein NusB
MLSRRNIRVKVMQVYFAYERDKELPFEEAIKGYREFIANSYHLLLYNLFLMVEATKFSLEEKDKRLTKYIKTQEDLEFRPKFYENEYVQSLENNKGFQKALKLAGIQGFADKDILRKIYKEFTQTKEYLSFMEAPDGDKQATVDVLLSLFKFLIKNEVFSELLEDKYLTWEDDKSLIVGTVKKIIKALPAEEDAITMYQPDEETVTEFGEELLKVLQDKKALHTEWIEPVLKNWEIDRVAKMDMVLLRMAIAEFTGFPSIPTKVTLNEYVEMSKNYSTDKSKEFINGILDNLMKQLQESGQINKVGRGLIE